MSDLFKKNRPRLSEDEERALWERVRTIPREAGGRRVADTGDRRRSPWEILWARPAVRFGAPALAVALVAVVWVTQREPVAPAREEATSRVTSPVAPEAAAPAGEPVAGSLPAPTSPAPAPVATAPTGANEADLRARRGAVPEEREQTQRIAVSQESAKDEAAGARSDAFATPPPAAEPLRTEAKLSKEESRSVAGAAGGDVAAKQKARAEAPASPQGVTGFYRDDPKVGTIRAVGEGTSTADDAARVAELRAARGSQTSAALIGDRILVEVIAPGRTGTFLETVSLPISGGVARIAVGNVAGSLVVEDGNVRDLVRIAGYEGVTDAASRRRVDLAPGASGAGAAALVAPDGRAITSRFVQEDGDTRALAGPRSTARSRAAALAAELILAVARGDASRVNRVSDAAHRLAADRPGDETARVLAAWSDDARAAFADR